VDLVLVALGGTFGAALRFSMSRVKSLYNIPMGTLLVNTLGCFLLPFFITAGNEAYLFFATGFSGSLTTFSTLGYESFRLAETGNFKGSLLNIIINLFLGALAFALGRKISGGIL